MSAYEDAMREFRKMVAASEHVHALVTAVLPAIAAGQLRGPVSWDSVPETMNEYVSDPELRREQERAVRALCDMGISDGSEVGLTMMTFAAKTATFVVLCARMLGVDPQQFWADHVGDFMAGASRL